MTNLDEHDGDGPRSAGAVVDLNAERDRRLPVPAEASEPAEWEPADVPPSVAVDGPDMPGPRYLARVRGAERRPIVPPVLRSAEQFRDSARWVAAHYAHTAGYHAARTPKYAGRLAFRAPVGGVRLLRRAVRWVADAEGVPVRAAAVRREDAEQYLKLCRQRDARVRARMIGAGLALLVLAVVAVLLLLAPRPVRWLVVAVTALVLGVLGGPADRPLVDRAVVATQVAKLTSDAVLRALCSIGVAGINQAVAKTPKAVGFPAPITRDGPGWRADVDLPPGVTAGEVADKRDKLASALARPLGCVWPEGNPDVHPGRLVIWVGDQDMARSKPVPWPLARSGAVDLFRPFRIGTDQRGRPVLVTLMFASMVIGAIPRMGKTFALRLLLLGAALDPRVELHTYDLKGTGDMDPLGPVAHRHRAGDDEDDIAYGLADMREVGAELRRRAKVIRGLPRDLCPENKVTPELAGMKSLRLHPIVIGVDECQKWFEHPTHGAELEAIVEDLVRRGPAVGIVPILATQRPDAKSLPTGISGNAALRFCLKVMGQVENDMVLGTSMYKAGIRATMFSRKDLGIGYLAGEGDDPRITRAHYVDGPAAERIVVRARAARERAGTLSGHALGQQPDAADDLAAASLLDDILAAVPVSEGKVWSETVVARLAELRPAVYIGWRPEQLASALKPHGVPTGRQVWGTTDDGKGANRKGIHRDDVADAVAERDRKRPAG